MPLSDPKDVEPPRLQSDQPGPFPDDPESRPSDGLHGTLEPDSPQSLSGKPSRLAR